MAKFIVRKTAGVLEVSLEISLGHMTLLMLVLRVFLGL